MAYSQKQIEDTFNDILSEIEQGNSLISILRRKEFPSTATFYQWLEADEDKAKRYVRACEIRADVIFEDIIDIADHSDEDHTPFTGANVVQRDRLKIDARKWIVAKLHPKKYSDRVYQDITTHQEQPLFPDVCTNNSNK
jgi:hypothetical protein